MSNNIIQNWFENGKIKEALLGKGKYLLRDNTWGRHDTLLVISQLEDWATTRVKKSLAREEFLGAIDSLSAEQKPLSVFRLFYVYFIIKNSRQSVLFFSDETVLINKIKYMVFQHSKDIAENNVRDSLGELRSTVIHLAKYVPDIYNVGNAPII